MRDVDGSWQGLVIIVLLITLAVWRIRARRKARRSK